MLEEVFFHSPVKLARVFKRAPSRANEHSMLLADDCKRRLQIDQGISCYLLDLLADNQSGISPQLEAIHKYWEGMKPESQAAKQIKSLSPTKIFTSPMAKQVTKRVNLDYSRLN